MTQENRTNQAHPVSSDLNVPVSESDHRIGSTTAAVTLVEYGDFGCRFCAEADQVVKALRTRFGASLCFVFRHNPRGELHPDARLTAEASEAAGLQGKFWEMHDTLYAHPHALKEADVLGYATALGLDLQKFRADLYSGAVAKRVRDDEVGGAHSCIVSTPTFFINGRRFHGSPEFEGLASAISAAS